METIEEVALIGVDETALQAMLFLPPKPEKHIVLLHAPGGGRHDRAVKTVVRSLAGQNAALLVPDLTDETEGWHGLKEDGFLASRAQAVIEWFLNKSAAKQLSVCAIEPTPALRSALEQLAGVGRVIVLAAGETPRWEAI